MSQGKLVPPRFADEIPVSDHMRHWTAILLLPPALPMVISVCLLVNNSTVSLKRTLAGTVVAQVVLFALVAGVESVLARVRGRMSDLPLGWKRGSLGFAAFLLVWSTFLLAVGVFAPSMFTTYFLLDSGDMVGVSILFLIFHVLLADIIHRLVTVF